MPSVLERPAVARNDLSIRLDAEVVSEAKMVAASRGTSLAEYLSEILRPIVHRDLESETTKRLKPRKPKAGD